MLIGLLASHWAEGIMLNQAEYIPPLHLSGNDQTTQLITFHTSYHSIMPQLLAVAKLGVTVIATFVVCWSPWLYSLESAGQVRCHPP